jgi:drug/metabolite transporter (DMT)-like permease
MQSVCQKADAEARPDARSRFPVQAVLALSAMLAFCLSDVLAKMLAPTIPPLEIAWFRYLGGVLVLAPVLIALRIRPQSVAPTIQILRSACMVAATTLLIAAVQRMPIAEATTLVFISPILMVLLSTTLLGEAIGWTRSVCMLNPARPIIAAASARSAMPRCARRSKRPPISC